MTEDQREDWEPRRLHPATIFLDAVRRAPAAVLAVPIFLVAMMRGGIEAEKALFFAIVAGMFGAGGLFLAWLRWLKFTYAIEGDALVIERGVLTRTRRAIPLERIQDVSIEQKLLARLFGVVTARVETGGSEKDEGKLDCVSVAEARRLRAALRGDAPAAEGPAPPPVEALFEMGLGRVLLFGLFNFSILWLVAIAAGFRAIDRFLDIEWRDIAYWFGVAEHEMALRFGVMAVLVAIGVLLVLGFVSGLVSTVVREFGFRLILHEGRFRRARGLLTRTELVITRRRIQLGLIERWPVSGALGWGALLVQSMGGSDDRAGRQQLAPFARDREIARIVDATGLPQFERAGLTPVSPRHVIRAAIRWPVPVGLAIGAAGIWFAPIWWGLLVLPVMLGVAMLTRRFHRYALRENSLQVMHGVVRRRDWTVPYAAIQAVRLRQGVLQRMLGIASVGIDTAGAPLLGRPDVEDIDADDARELALGVIGRF